jgi:hypothetical protein
MQHANTERVTRKHSNIRGVCQPACRIFADDRRHRTSIAVGAIIECLRFLGARTEMLLHRVLQNVHESISADRTKDARDIRLVVTRQYGCKDLHLYQHERNHQGLGNRLIAANDTKFAGGGAVTRRARVGGMLNFYFREAA